MGLARRAVAGLLALALWPAATRAAEPTNALEALELLARLVVLQERCPKAGINYLALGIILQRTGVSDRTLETEPQAGQFRQALGKARGGLGSLAEAEACDLVFEAYGAKGIELAGLVIEAHPNDPFAFFNALGRGLQTLRRFGVPDRKDTDK
jgi:hypothetical protein